MIQSKPVTTCSRCGNDLDGDQCMSCHMVQPKPQTTIFGVDLAKKEPWYKRLAARIFGMKFRGSDTTAMVSGYWYKGKLYIEYVKYD